MSEQASKKFRLEMQVRDYECDMGGIVNNGVYLNYFEHARHEFLKSMGINFAEYAQRKINFVVVRSEIDYKGSLRTGDVFIVSVTIERVSKLRFAFYQSIHTVSSQKSLCEAKIFGAVLDERGRPFVPLEIAAMLDNSKMSESSSLE